MKKMTFVLILVSLASALVAQDFEKYRIGFKVSPNVSWFHPDNKSILSDGGARLRYGFALNFDKHFTANYAIGTGLNIFTAGGEIEYLQKESIPDTMTQVFSVNRNYRLQYGEIPLTLKLRTNEIGYMTYWAQFGVGLGVNISAKADEEIIYRYQIDNDDINNDGALWESLPGAFRRNSVEEDVDVKSDIAIFRTSLIIGAGVEYNLSGNTSILAGVTFNNGFSDALRGDAVERDSGNPNNFVRDGEGNPNMYRLKSRTNFVELNIGILF